MPPYIFPSNIPGKPNPFGRPIRLDNLAAIKKRARIIGAASRRYNCTHLARNANTKNAEHNCDDEESE